MPSLVQILSRSAADPLELLQLTMHASILEIRSSDGTDYSDLDASDEEFSAIR